MGANRTTFEKLQRDRAKKAKAAAKRDKRLGRTVEPPTADMTSSGGETETVAPESIADEIEALPEGEVIPAHKLLEMVATVHEQFDKGTISFEEFEERKAELLARVMVD